MDTLLSLSIDLSSSTGSLGGCTTARAERLRGTNSSFGSRFGVSVLPVCTTILGGIGASISGGEMRRSGWMQVIDFLKKNIDFLLGSSSSWLNLSSSSISPSAGAGQSEELRLILISLIYLGSGLILHLCFNLAAL